MLKVDKQGKDLDQHQLLIAELNMFVIHHNLQVKIDVLESFKIHKFFLIESLISQLRLNLLKKM